MEWLTPEVGGAIGAGVGALLLGMGIQGKAKNSKTAVHQQIARPDTRSEIRSAEALERIAVSIDMIERHMSIFMDRKQR